MTKSRVITVGSQIKYARAFSSSNAACNKYGTNPVIPTKEKSGATA